MIDSSQANSALADIADIGRRVRQSLFYQRTSSMLILWGAMTALGYLVSFVAPGVAGYVWTAVFIAGIGGSAAIGAISAKRNGVHTFDGRMLAAFLGFILFGCLWSIGIGHFTGRQLGVFWPTYFMMVYCIVGLWLGRAFVAIGLSVTALTLIGYFFIGAWFELWMAFVNGGGLLMGGLWMRRN